MPRVRRRLAERAGRLERALVVLMALAVLQLVAWAILLPPWQGPDEISHFAYTQRMVETTSVPWFPGGNPGDQQRPYAYSEELRLASDWGGGFALMLNTQGRPPGSPVSEALWRQAETNAAPVLRDDGGFTSAMVNPPLYYVYQAIPYAATTKLSIFDRQFVMRLFNAPLLIAAVWLTWLIAGQLLGAGWPRVLATAAVALNPQLTEIAAIVDPDILLAVEWIAFLYLAVMAIRHGPTRWRVAGLAALSVASCLTHGRGVAILVPLAFAGGALVWRYRRPGRRVTIATAAVLSVVGLAVLHRALVYATSGGLTLGTTKQFASYLWQFYLPKLGFMNPTTGPRDYGVREVFVDRFYGTYGALDVFFGAGVLSLLFWLSIGAIVLALVGLVLRWSEVRHWWDVVALFVVAVSAYLFGLHLAAFKSLLGGTGDPVLTGRYMLPFMPIYGLAMAMAVAWLPRRLAPIAAGAVAGGLCLLSVGALGVTLARYYA